MGTDLNGKTAPVINKRKREGIQLCKVYDLAKPPKWRRAIFEAKFDGYRCIAKIKEGKAELLTSTGLPHWNVDYIREDLEELACVYPFYDNTVFDGEITHKTLPFDEAGGLLRNHNEDLTRAREFVLHIWDCLPLKDFEARSCDIKLSERKNRLSIVDTLLDKLTLMNLAIVSWYEGDVSEAEKYAREFVIEDGEEGIVLKDADGLYEFRKSGTWLKWKPKFSANGIEDMKEGDFKITGIQMGRGKHQGRVGAIFVEGYLTDDGNISSERDSNSEFGGKLMVGKAGTGFDDSQREQFLVWFNEGTLVGRTVEIHYQQLSSKGKVRFPVFYRLRPDKDEQ